MFGLADAKRSLLHTSFIFARDVFRYFTHQFSRFRGVYESFPQARARASSTKRIGFNHADLARKYEAEVCLNLDNSDYPVLYHLSRILTDNCTVLDFGGNVGVHYLRYRKHLRGEKVRWIVCDVPEITKVGRELCAGISNIAFVNDIHEINESKIDVFLASDSLQYIESNSLLLPSLIDRGIRPRHILIDQLPLYDGPQFVTLQNGGLVRYPQYVFNRKEYVNSIVDVRYEFIDSWDCSNFSCTIPFHPERLVRTYSGLYFRAADENEVFCQ